MPSLASSPDCSRMIASSPVSRSPTRLDIAVTVHVLPVSASTPSANQSSRGPGTTRSTPSVRMPGDTGRTLPVGSPAWMVSPLASGDGPSPESRSVEDDPSTVSAMTPPRTPT